MEMEYIKTLKERFKELKNSFNENRRIILKKFPYKEYEAIGQSACYFYVRHERTETEHFYEEAIDLLEEAVLNQLRFIEKEVSHYYGAVGWNNNYDTHLFKQLGQSGKI
jgi:hypothetical protein